MLKVKRTAALLAVSLMLPALPSAFAVDTIPEGTVIYEDNLSGQQVGGTPSGMFNVNQTTFEQSGVGINTNDDAVIAADPSMPTGKYISLQGSNNLYADFNKDNEGSALRVNATGQWYENQTLYAVTWNQFIDNNQQEHTSWTRNRATVLRFINSGGQGGYKDGTANSGNSHDLGTAHFQGSRLNIIDNSQKAASAQTLERGKWYTFKAYIHANKQNDTEDIVKIIAYEYGTNESDDISAEYLGSFPVNADSMRIYYYDDGSTDIESAISDIKITSYSGSAADDYLALADIAKTVDITPFTTEAITSADALNSFAVPEGADSIVWSSNNPDVLSVEDNVFTLNAPAEDTELCLTLTLVKGGASDVLYVPVTVKGTGEAEKTSIDSAAYENGTVNVTINVNEKFDLAKEYIAVYNSNGELCALCGNEAENGAHTRKITAELEPGRYSVKLMLWQDNMKPVMNGTGLTEASFTAGE